MLLTQIDHVAIAAHDLADAVDYYGRIFGAEVCHREGVDRDGVDEAVLRVGESYIQLTTGTRPNSLISTFLERHDEGIYHVGYRVDDGAEGLAAVVDAGGRAIDETLRPGLRGTTVAFVHPKGAFGTLVELVEEPTDR